MSASMIQDVLTYMSRFLGRRSVFYVLSISILLPLLVAGCDEEFSGNESDYATESDCKLLNHFSININSNLLGY